MKNIKLGYLVLIFGLTALWFFAESVFDNDYSFFTLRTAMMNYTGIIGLGVMSIAMILAIRPALFESWLGGLDKSYRLHKWLGITGLSFSIIHYLWANVPKWMVGLGLLIKPERQRPAEESLAILRFFQQQRGLAESIGEWAFYGALILMILALVKWFPYKYFFKTHRFIAIAYLLLACHGIILINYSYWAEFIGPVMGVIVAGGIVGALFSLTGSIGFRRRFLAEIASLEFHQDNKVLKVILNLKGSWPGHKAGQFAFINFDDDEGPHPFTISSSWKNDGQLDLMIKGLGDYTKQLPKNLKIGSKVHVEGPYGEFNFHSEKEQQIWVAGGIGITPFISRMQMLAESQHHKKIDLFYSTSEPDESFIASIKKSADKANINLHLITPTTNDRVNTDLITQLVPEWEKADVWFCGPASFGKSIKNGFIRLGIAAESFHQELFEMR
jgi:predicted ferric reductase